MGKPSKRAERAVHHGLIKPSASVRKFFTSDAHASTHITPEKHS
jgi:hypothetical protein